MKQTLILIASLFPGLLFAQISNKEKLENADKLLEKEKYATSLLEYRSLYSSVDRNDSLMSDISYGLSASLFYVISEVRLKNEWQKTIDLSKEFINVLDENKETLGQSLYSKKYWAIKDILVAYNGLEMRDSANIYREKLYAAKKMNLLPEVLNEYYNFEKIVYNNLNIWGYEWFLELGEKGTEGSFSKHVYYVYSTDKEGMDKDQLYTLETVKIHKLKEGGDDYVLTKRTYNDDNLQSESIWKYTFSDPVDHTTLHNAVMDVLKGNVKPDTKSVIKN